MPLLQLVAEIEQRRTVEEQLSQLQGALAAASTAHEATRSDLVQQEGRYAREVSGLRDEVAAGQRQVGTWSGMNAPGGGGVRG